jgi:hypothetical protein
MPNGLKRQLVFFIFSILLLIPLNSYSQDSTSWSKCLSISKAAKFLSGLADNMAVVERGNGWAKWGSDTLKAEIFAVAANDTSKMADVLILSKNDSPYIALGTNPGGDKYSYCCLAAQLCSGYRVTAWASRDDGYIDRVKFVSKKGINGLVADLDRAGRASFFAYQVLDSVWNILLLDSAGTKPVLYLLFANGKYISAAEIPQDNSAIRDISCLLSEGQWKGYVLDSIGANIVGLTISDSLFGKIKQGLFDLTGDGQFDAHLVYSGLSKNYIALEAELQSKEYITEASEIADMTIIVKAAITRWNQLRDAVREFDAFGYELPEVMQLPK